MGRALRILLVLLIGSANWAVAQGTVPPPPVLVFEHDGRNVTGYVLYATAAEGGVVLAFDLGPLRPDRAGKVTVAVPALPNGVYRLEVAAYNQRGEGPRATAVPPTIEVATAPPVAATRPNTAEPLGPAPKEAAAAPAVIPPAPKPEGVPKASEAVPKRSGGVFGKLWRVVIGSDEPVR